VPEDQPLEDQVQHRVDNQVAWITLNRPRSETPSRPTSATGSSTSWRRPRPRSMSAPSSFTATGKGFCTGADLRAGGRRSAPARPEGAPDRVMGEAARMIRRGAQRLVGAVLDCEKPVIAAVNGTAAGIGAHLAFACDLVVAATEARFIEVFVRRGISPTAAAPTSCPV